MKLNNLILMPLWAQTPRRLKSLGAKIQDNRGKISYSLPLMLLENHLKKVSRSFAFCIAELSPYLREKVSVMYLFCRILDTIEDAPDLSLEAKQALFDDIIKACGRSVYNADDARAPFLRVESKFLKDVERDLLQDFPEILEKHYSGFNEQTRKIILELLQTMSEGMLQFEKKRQFEGRLVIESAAELERYCYVVAGCVGEALSRLVFGDNPPEKLLKLSREFGSFLQKINMIKDRSGDEREGRDFLGFVMTPEAHSQLRFPEMVNSVWQYIEHLGSGRHDRFRLFCAWSFALGLRTLTLWENKNFSWSSQPLKVSKLDAMQIIAAVKGANGDILLLKNTLQKIAPLFSQGAFPRTTALAT